MLKPVSAPRSRRPPQARPWPPRSSWTHRRDCRLPRMPASGCPPTSCTASALPPAPPPWCVQHTRTVAAACAPAQAFQSMVASCYTRAAVGFSHVSTCLQVGVAGSGDSPAPLAELFAAAYQLPSLAAAGRAGPQRQEQQQPGTFLVPAQVWPLQGLPKGTVVLSPVLRDALARPEAGARLLVYAAAAAQPGEGSGGGGGIEGSSSHADQRCAAVYVRLCRRQGPAGDPVPILLPPHASEAAPVAGSSGGPALEAPADRAGSREAPVSPAAGLSPAMRGKAGSPAALSPAMRGAAAPPVALSPAMRAGAAPPVALGPVGRAGSSSSSSRGSPAATARGRATSAASPSSSVARPPTPSASATSSGSARAVAATARVEDRAKAEALLGALLAEGEWLQGWRCQSGREAAMPHWLLQNSCQPDTPASPPFTADASPRVRAMVEALLLRCLAGRQLLPGNVAALPLFGQHAMLVVEHVALASGSGSGVPSAAGADAATAEAADGQPHTGVVPHVTADTAVRLLLEGEAPPGAGTQPQQHDWPAAAAAAAAEALGCSPEDAGALAAARALAAGLASRGITFDQLGGAAQQVRGPWAASWARGAVAPRACMW